MNYLDSNQKTYDILAEEYEEKAQIRESFNSIFISNFLKHLRSGLRILDKGCAVGVDLKIFKEKGFSPVGIDISKEMINFARKRNPETDIIEGDFLKIDFNERFDGIFAQGFIHLFSRKDVKKVLEKIKNILKDGGIAFISTTKSDQSKEGFFNKDDYRGGYKRFRKFWTKDELWNILSKYFKIIDYYEMSDSINDSKFWMIFIVENERN